MSLRAKWRPGDKFLVRHKDADVVVVDKKAGYLSVPSDGGGEANLRDMLAEWLGGRAPIHAVHRLDKMVSGLLVFARNRHAHDHLTEQFKAHSVDRRYVALVLGVVREDEGTFESRFEMNPVTLRMYSTQRGGKRAITHYRVLERLLDHTLVEVRLETGLKNQIRVHFAEAGHPLLGERKYADVARPRGKSIQGKSRLFLHARTLGFVHPASGRKLEFSSELPPDLATWLDKQKRRR